jgi:hypothetical protein
MCPVSAAVIAAEIVAKSRISPTRKRFGEARDVYADFPLADRRLLVLVVVLNWVFDRDDVVIEVLVQPVDHAGERGRFSGAGWTGHKKEPAGTGDDAVDRGGQPELLEREELERDSPQHDPDVAALLEDRHPEPSLVAEGHPKVGAADLLEFRLTPLGGDALHESSRIVHLERLGFQSPHVAVEADDGGLPHRNVKVAGSEVDDRLEQFIDLDRRHAAPLLREANR